MSREAFYIEVDGSKLAWYAKEEKYTSAIRTILGIKKATNTTKGLIFGANQPRMPRLRLNFEAGTQTSLNRGGLSSGRRSQIVFCAPDKVKDCTIDNKLKGKASNSYTIKSASLVGTGT